MSHPTRVRGLKRFGSAQLTLHIMSHPTRVRGLKLIIYFDICANQVVAPHAGAWIETLSRGGCCFFLIRVAPHAGAWIETSQL